MVHFGKLELAIELHSLFERYTELINTTADLLIITPQPGETIKQEQSTSQSRINTAWKLSFLSPTVIKGKGHQK